MARAIVVDRRSAEGNFARLPILAEEIVKSRPDIIVAIVLGASGAFSFSRSDSWTA
jgi:hypothetical protein